MGARKKVKGIVDDYKQFLKANVAALRAKDIEPPEDKDDLPEVVEENLDVEDEHLEMFDRWESVVEKVKHKDMDDLDDKEIYELKNETKEFVKEVSKEYRDMKEEKTEEAEKMAPDMDTTSVAQAADTEEMIPNLQEKAEREVESEDEDEEEEK